MSYSIWVSASQLQSRKFLIFIFSRPVLLYVSTVISSCLRYSSLYNYYPVPLHINNIIIIVLLLQIWDSDEKMIKFGIVLFKKYGNNGNNEIRNLLYSCIYQ